MAGKAASKPPAPASAPSALVNLVVFSVLMVLVPLCLFYGSAQGYLDRERRHRGVSGDRSLAQLAR